MQVTFRPQNKVDFELTPGATPSTNNRYVIDMRDGQDVIYLVLTYEQVRQLHAEIQYTMGFCTNV